MQEAAMIYLQAYAIGLVIFLAADALWLGLIARGFYRDRMGSLLRPDPRWGVAAIFYAVYLIGLVYFAMTSGLAGGDWLVAARDGALFGLFTYLTYNCTNLAVMRGFDPGLALVDTIWGSFLGALVAGGTVTALELTGALAG